MLFYNLGILLFYEGVKIAALFQDRARRWLSGRKNWQARLQQQMQAHAGKQVLWFHAASLGEFEQGRPVIETFRKKHPQACIVVSFFSPSGYEIQKHYSQADVVSYLPIDLPGSAKKFIEIINPTVAIFVKYEFWLNYLKVLKSRTVKTYLISAVFHDRQPFFKWYGGIFRKALDSYTFVYVQDKQSEQKLKKLGFHRVETTGDTRVDRVITIAKESTKDLKFLETFKDGKTLWIAGSTWPKDDKLIIEVYLKLRATHPYLKLMIAPHEVDKKHVSILCELLTANGLKFALFTEQQNTSDPDVYVLNTIGYLSSCYRLAEFVYIGGGYGDGVHSTLEPAAYYKPLFFGPNYHKFVEAVGLVDLKAAKAISGADELITGIKTLLNNKHDYNLASKAVESFVALNKGATEKLVERIGF